MVRLRIEHSGFSTLNNQRFGSKFVGDVSNLTDMLLFSKKQTLEQESRLTWTKTQALDVLHLSEQKLELLGFQLLSPDQLQFFSTALSRGYHIPRRPSSSIPLRNLITQKNAISFNSKRMSPNGYQNPNYSSLFTNSENEQHAKRREVEVHSRTGRDLWFESRN